MSVMPAESRYDMVLCPHANMDCIKVAQLLYHNEASKKGKGQWYHVCEYPNCNKRFSTYRWLNPWDAAVQTRTAEMLPNLPIPIEPFVSRLPVAEQVDTTPKAGPVPCPCGKGKVNGDCRSAAKGCKHCCTVGKGCRVGLHREWAASMPSASSAPTVNTTAASRAAARVSRDPHKGLGESFNQIRATVVHKEQEVKEEEAEVKRQNLRAGQLVEIHVWTENDSVPDTVVCYSPRDIDTITLSTKAYKGLYPYLGYTPGENQPDDVYIQLYDLDSHRAGIPNIWKTYDLDLPIVKTRLTHYFIRLPSVKRCHGLLDLVDSHVSVKSLAPTPRQTPTPLRSLAGSQQSTPSSSSSGPRGSSQATAVVISGDEDSEEEGESGDGDITILPGKRRRAESVSEERGGKKKQKFSPDIQAISNPSPTPATASKHWLPTTFPLHQLVQIYKEHKESDKGLSYRQLFNHHFSEYDYVRAKSTWGEFNTLMRQSEGKTVDGVKIWEKYGEEDGGTWSQFRVDAGAKHR